MSVRIENQNLHVFNPATGEDIQSITITSLKEMDDILNIAKTKAEEFNFSSISHRHRLITKLRKKLVSRMDDFVEIICLETGKKSEEGITEIFTSVEHLKQAGKLSRIILTPERRRTGLLKTKRATVWYEPHGVAGIISPWNYPLILTIAPMAEALLAGNTVVLKPSEHTPLTVKLLKEIWDNATDEPDIFQVVYGAGEVGHQLVSSPNIDIICFTGSTAVGKKIAETCAPLFKPVILELGGKDPLIVMDDANLTRAADAAIWGGMSNAGQTCISIEKIFIHNSKKSEYLDLLKIRINTLKTGPDNQDDIGAITVENSHKKILSQIDEVRNSAEIIQGTLSNDSNGWFIPPTLVIDPPAESKIISEETFGPVITVQGFDNENELINNVNDSNGYGLSANIFSKNRKRALLIARKIRTGSVNINDVLTQYGIADLPFGGVGKSGIGLVHGEEGLKAFSRVKSILENRISLQTELWWYKNITLYRRVVKKIIRWFYG